LRGFETSSVAILSLGALDVIGDVDDLGALALGTGLLGLKHVK